MSGKNINVRMDESLRTGREPVEELMVMTDYTVCMAICISLAIERPLVSPIGQRIVLCHAYPPCISTACQRDTNLVIWSTKL